MASSNTTSVSAYLDELPEPRRAVIEAVRDEINRNLPDGYSEQLGHGMIVWSVPLTRYPDTYNKQPLMFVALAAQKNNYALYLTCVYISAAHEAALRAAHDEAGIKIDMGKSCLRFKSLERLPLPAIGAMVALMPVDAFIAMVEQSRGGCR
ncbi:MAG: DUF1801 domain-containing protein [Dokdonella sp.]